MRIALTLSLVLGGLATIVHSAPAAEPDWQIIQQLFQLDRILPPAGQEESPVFEPHEYLFERFANMDAAVFRNGLTFVLQKYPPPQDPADLSTYQQDMQYKLRVIFEYYPLAARERDDFDTLVDLIYHGREPDVLRVFLIRQLGPGLEPLSTFGTYMQSHALKDQEAFDKRLRELVQLPQDSAPVQVAAIDALLARTDEYYTALLARDALAAARPEAAPTLHIRQFIDNPKATQLSKRTQQLLDQKNAAGPTTPSPTPITDPREQKTSPTRTKHDDAPKSANPCHAIRLCLFVCVKHGSIPNAQQSTRQGCHLHRRECNDRLCG